MNDACAVPVPVCVWAELLSVDESTTGAVALVPDTENVTDAALLSASVAVMIVSPAGVPAGMVMYARNDGPAIVVGDVVTTTVPTWMNIVEPAANPLPSSCTVVPATPEVGVAIIVGLAAVNVAVALFPWASTTMTVFVADAVAGIVIVTPPGNEPTPVVVVTAVAELYSTTPLKVTLKLLVTAKPVPATPTTVPLIAVVGVKVAFGTIESVDVAISVPSPTNRVYVPLAIAGTTNQVVRLYAFVPVVVTVVEPNDPNRFVVPSCATVTAVRPTTVMLTF